LAGNKVKKKRTIYVKVASSVKPKIKMPNLVDLSFRQAQTILETYGLILGKTTYVPDIAQNAVLEMKNKSKMLHPGDLVEKGDVIDLTLGLGMGGTLVEVPYLIGFTVEEAERILEVSMLRAGAIVADETVKDRSKAIIYKQMPDPLKKDLIPAGKVIDLYITLDKSKIQQDETSTED
jgi:beta-lactam-binding protein with PASTA domain